MLQPNLAPHCFENDQSSQTMDISSLPIKKTSVEEYLDQEFTSTERHEFFSGKVTIMAYASDNHELIIANILRELGLLLKETPYRIYPSNRMLHIPDSKRFYYADAIVVDGKPEFFLYKKKMQATTNPCTIIEVLSDSTERKDRGEKWQGYRTIPSLKEYILIAQDEVYVEIFRKIEETHSAWRNEYYDQLEQSVSIAGKELPLAEVYRDVELDVTGETTENT